MPPPTEVDASLQARWVAALCSAHRDPPIRRIETHISHVLLTGAFAYKIKKAIRLPFLDFSTLAARHHYCEQELALNRRLAPALYLDVVPITGSVDAPAIEGSGPVIDYAVKMREFAQDALLSAIADRGGLQPIHVDRLAATVARFHGAIPAAPRDGDFGSPELILDLATANFAEFRAIRADIDATIIDGLETWTRREHAAKHAIFAARRERGFVRECHGDLHLANIAWLDDEIAVFDCIEFNERMRWIDVMSEVAFTAMDLESRGERALAYRFLDAYLSATGDYAGVEVLAFYVVYRAMVRAKIACLRASQHGGASDASAEVGRYLRVAQRHAAGSRSAVIITHGFAGCGKTTLSQALLEGLGAIRIRTDVERKRLHGLDALASTRSAVGDAIYGAEATRATYGHVRALARSVVEGGFTVLVDATFLAREHRDLFRQLALELRVPFAIVDIRAPEATLRLRIARRAEQANDASEANAAVLDHQLRTHDPLAPNEHADVVAIDGEAPIGDPAIARALDAIAGRLRC